MTGTADQGGHAGDAAAVTADRHAATALRSHRLSLRQIAADLAELADALDAADEELRQ